MGIKEDIIADSLLLHKSMSELLKELSKCKDIMLDNLYACPEALTVFTSCNFDSLKSSYERLTCLLENYLNLYSFKNMLNHVNSVQDLETALKYYINEKNKKE